VKFSESEVRGFLFARVREPPILFFKVSATQPLPLPPSLMNYSPKPGRGGNVRFVDAV